MSNTFGLIALLVLIVAAVWLSLTVAEHIAPTIANATIGVFEVVRP